MHYLELVKERAPLIHNITNQVVMNVTANGLYASVLRRLWRMKKKKWMTL